MECHHEYTIYSNPRPHSILATQLLLPLRFPLFISTPDSGVVPLERSSPYTQLHEKFQSRKISLSPFGDLVFVKVGEGTHE